MTDQTTGLLSQLTPEQRERALSYDGPEAFGPTDGPRIAQTTPAWQPIETAPKDGRHVWVTGNHGSGILLLVCWHEGAWVHARSETIDDPDDAAFWLPEEAINLP